MIGQTKIMKIIDSTEKVIKIIVDPNPFHPAGGGQPGDTGCLRAENFLAHVIDCQKEGEEIVLYIKVKSGTIHENMQVESFVDLERQWLLSRMHSGEHVISKVLENTYPELHIYKVDVGTESTAVYLRYPHELNWEILFKAEEDANEVIKKDLPVTVDVLSPEDAKKMIDLKANWERIGENDLVRVVTIPDFDMIACSGTHVCRTSDIGGVFIEGFNGRAPEWEFRFTVHREEAMRKESYVMRKLLRTIGCPLEKLEEVFKRLQMENKALIKGLDHLKEYVSFPWVEQSMGGHPLYSFELPNIPIEVVSSCVSRKLKEIPEAICLCIVPAEEGCHFLLGGGEKTSLDLQGFVKNNRTLGIRGGGRKDWVSGKAQCTYLARWVEELQVYFVNR